LHKYAALFNEPSMLHCIVVLMFFLSSFLFLGGLHVNNFITTEQYKRAVAFVVAVAFKPNQART
jgi:hypothetical protein